MDRKGSRTSRRRPARDGRKYQRPLNRYEIESGEASCSSASTRKIRNDFAFDTNVMISYRILNFFSVFTLLSNYVSCKQCGGDITFLERSIRGLGFKLVVKCTNCDPVSIDSCPLIDNAYEVNKRFIFAMRLLGVGLNGAEKFCAFMDLPRPIFQSFYDKVVESIKNAANTVRQLSLSRAVAEEIAATKKELGEEDIPGITVSGDGSWKKRGFKSLLGIASLIGLHTGKIIDVVMKSKICKSCLQMVPLKGTAPYDEWQETHSDICEITHDRASRKMEIDGIREMFERSRTFHNVKYINYVGDGDSETYKSIVDARPYGDTPIGKKECINHVQKRLGSRLRAVKKSAEGLNGKGRLTHKVINDLTNYYGLAIRRNPHNITDMYNAIWATIYHKSSSKEDPRHYLCPEGADSWCYFQRALANDSLDTFVEKQPLPEDVVEAILPIYEDLSKPELLERCVGGFTQNDNECFNSLVWQIAPKSNSTSSTVVETALSISTIIFNDGRQGLLKIFESLGIEIGPTVQQYCAERDEARALSVDRHRENSSQGAVELIKNLNHRQRTTITRQRNLIAALKSKKFRKWKETNRTRDFNPTQEEGHFR